MHKNHEQVALGDGFTKEELWAAETEAAAAETVDYVRLVRTVLK